MAKNNIETIAPLDALIALDGAVATALAPYGDHPAVRAIGFVGKQGDQPQMLALSGLVLVGGLLRGDRRVMNAGARMIAAHLLATGAKHLVKRRIDRHRPPRNGGEAPQPKPRPGRRSAKEWTSFPSGHTAGAVAVARAFARVFPEHAGRASAGAAAVSLAQVCKQAHYVSDVTAGAAIGLAAEAAVDRLWPRRRLA